MPYIITTSRRRNSGAITLDTELSRHAVATLDEARSDCRAACIAQAVDPSPAYHAADTLPEPGGTIGPLPDGTVIEVERVKWRDVTNPTDWRDRQPSQDEILAVFNGAAS